MGIREEEPAKVGVIITNIKLMKDLKEGSGKDKPQVSRL